MTISKTAAVRKAAPIARGVLDYFPDAIMEVAHVSLVGNEQHNPGQPLHWAKEKSTDEADCIARHLLERGTFDTDGLRHSAKVAWRALALLQRELEMDAEKAPAAAAEPGAVVYYTPTTEPRRARATEGGCGAIGGSDCGLYGCERELGHPGNHMAWSDYEQGTLYQGGEW